MAVRKLYNFPDPNLDRQIVELVMGQNALSASVGPIVLLPDLSSGKVYGLTVQFDGATPQLVLNEMLLSVSAGIGILLAPDLTTGKIYMVMVEVTDGVPQEVLTELSTSTGIPLNVLMLPDVSTGLFYAYMFTVELDGATPQLVMVQQ
jgi:hypothetical protein